MSEYKTIFGKAVKALASDPTDAGAEGQIWYNTTTGSFRTVLATGAWSSGSPLIIGRSQAGGNGIQDAALICGGYTTAGVASTEEYNGNGWGTGGDLNTARYALKSAGTQTSAIAFGGYTGTAYHTTSETYNGTSWTNGPAINTGRTSGSQAGTSTAALYAGGGIPTVVNNSEEYNGTSWTEGNNLNTARTVVGGSGIQTAALAAGGEQGPPGYTGATELYDGTSWTTSPASLNVIKGGQAQSGTQTSSLAYGGYTGTAATGATESWDGTSWTNLSPVVMAVARNATEGAGADSTSAVCFGGDPQKSDTEEYNFSASVITAGAWASGANYPVTIQDAAGAGPVTANVTWGGFDGPAYTAATNEYNGSAWTSSGNMNTARALYQTGIGTQTAAIGTSGYIPGGGPSGSTNTESYDGSTWTNVNSLNTSRYNATATGIQTSGIITGGQTPAQTSATEEWDGTSWTAGGSTPVVSAALSMSGQSNTDALLISASSPPVFITLLYNGTSWSDTGHNLLDQKTGVAGGSQQGTTNAAIIAGGLDSSPAIVSTSFQYNGSSWVTAPSISTARYGGAASGTYQSALAVGGEQPTQSNATEEWTGETTALNYKTITTS